MSDNLPNVEEFAELLCSLLGDDIQVKPGDGIDPTAAAVKAFYVDSDGVPAKCIACDVEFANAVGAALTKIPPPTVEAANKANEVPDNIYENFYEVLNICVNAFPSNSTKHVVLGNVVTPGREAGATDIKPEGSPVTFAVDIPRYGVGTVALTQLSS
ncbi:MAG: hypothetical protein KDB27_15465 [Planctomycetales bacterium]|nr:hypothetical protein [Planctomycetales bacterium]